MLCSSMLLCWTFLHSREVHLGPVLNQKEGGRHTLKKSRWLYTPPALFLTALLMFMGTAPVPTTGIICSTVSTCMSDRPSAHMQVIHSFIRYTLSDP